MGLIKKIDVEKHFAARRAMRQGRTGPLSAPGVAGIKSAAERRRAPTSAKSSHLGTFFLERTSSIRSRTRPILRRNRLLRPPGIRQQ